MLTVGSPLEPMISEQNTRYCWPFQMVTNINIFNIPFQYLSPFLAYQLGKCRHARSLNESIGMNAEYETICWVGRTQQKRGIHIPMVVKKWSTHFQPYKYFRCLYYVLFLSHPFECDTHERETRWRMQTFHLTEHANTHVRYLCVRLLAYLFSCYNHSCLFLLSLVLSWLFGLSVVVSLFRPHCLQNLFGKNQTETYDSGVNNHISQIHTESARSLSVHEFSVLFAFSIKYFRSLECLFRIVPLLNCVRKIEKSFRAAVYLCMVWWIRLCDIAITQQYTVASLAHNIMHALVACLYWYRSDDNDNGTALLFNTQPTYTHMQIGKKQRPKENEPGISVYVKYALIFS